MELELLRQLFNTMMNDLDETSRPRHFEQLPNNYDLCIPLVKALFEYPAMESIACKDCEIVRTETGILIKDPQGKTDTYSYHDAKFLIDNWEKSSKAASNTFTFVMDKYE